MILDTSAVAAILFADEDGATYAAAIRDADVCLIAAPTFVELCTVVEAHAGDVGILECDRFFRNMKITIEPFTEEQAYAARQAYSEFGKGRHRAGLNLGDCFSYALAKTTGDKLLFKGNDFRKTDVKAAI
jgi:ribonuclease VapC